MASEKRWSRRDLLRAGVAAGSAAAGLTSGARLIGAAPSGDDSSAKSQTFLFLDWFHVKKGELQVVLDPARISADGQEKLAMYDRDFKKKFLRGSHGFRQTDVPSGVRITPEVAERSQPWLVADQPWETKVSSPTVIHDEGRFRCWYGARLKGGLEKSAVEGGQVMELGGSALAYAESDDGITWRKPVVGTIPFAGSKEHNLVSGFGNGGAVFRDDHGPAAERYKYFEFAEMSEADRAADAGNKARYALFGITSPDGYRWTKNPKPLVKYFSDTVNVAGWDAALGRYVGYFRHHFSSRTISRAETDDFWNWPDPQPFWYAGPLDAPADDFYTNCCTSYPGDPQLRLLFPAIYHRDDDSVDVRLAVSRDGRVFQWVSYDPVVTLGTAGAWDGGSIYTQPNLVQLPDGRLALPFDAYNGTHNEAWFEIFYGDHGHTVAVGWALWKDGRLAGIEAVDRGEFTTTTARFQGNRIELNARTTRGGSVEVELAERGEALPGFTFAECVPFAGDELWTPLKWQGRDDLSSLSGKSIDLRIRLRSAKLFAVRFA